MNAIRALAEARQALTQTQDDVAKRLAEVQRETAEQVAAAEHEDVRLYGAALAAGWSRDELRKIGFTEPAKRTRVRRSRTAAARRQASNAGAPDGADQLDASSAE